MSTAHPLLDRDHLLETMTIVLDHVRRACPEVAYRFVGTGAALLHGVDLPAGDIDILVKERSDVDAWGAALASFTCLFPPTWLPDAHQYYANVEVNGVEVGISTVEVDTASDAIETLGSGSWEHFSLIACGPHTVPTVALELRLVTELYRDRRDRIAPIILYLRAHGCDLDLVRRGMALGPLQQALQEDVLGQLAGAPDC